MYIIRKTPFSGANGGVSGERSVRVTEYDRAERHPAAAFHNAVIGHLWPQLSIDRGILQCISDLSTDA